MSSALPDGARAFVVTASNRAAAGVYEDRSGQALAAGLRDLGFAVEGPHVHPDDVDELEAVLGNAVDLGFDVVLTTGGTGLSPTDVTPEATQRVLEREAPGLAEAMRLVNPLGRLSRGMAGTIGETLILNTPGSPKGAVECLEAVLDVVPHALELLRGGRPH